MNPDTTITLPKNLLAAASTDPTRIILNGAFIDPDARAIVCTNGRILTKIPIPGDAPVKTGYITPDVLKIANARNPKALEFDYVSGLLNGEPTDMPDDIGCYPNWQQVMPNETPVYRVTFDPKYIASIAKGLGQTKEGITFHFGPRGESPALATMQDKTAVIMPMRTEEQSGLLVATDKDAEKLRSEVASLRKALSERSDKSTGNASDEAMIEALRTEMLQARARVKELEAIIASTDTTTGNQQPLARPAQDAMRKGKERPPVPAATDRPTVSRNTERDGIELRFNGKPDDQTRAAMKTHGFRWLPRQDGQPWAAKYSEERWIFAHHLATGSAYTPMPDPQAAASPDATQASTHPSHISPDPRVRKIQIPDF